MTDYSTSTVEEALPDARRYAKRDGESWIMRDHNDRFHIINPYSEQVEKHYLETLKWRVVVRLTADVKCEYIGDTSEAGHLA